MNDTTYNTDMDDYQTYNLKISIAYNKDNKEFTGFAQYTHPDGSQVYTSGLSSALPVAFSVSSFNRTDILNKCTQWALQQESEMVERYLRGQEEKYKEDKKENKDMAPVYNEKECNGSFSLIDMMKYLHSNVGAVAVVPDKGHHDDVDVIEFYSLSSSGVLTFTAYHLIFDTVLAGPVVCNISYEFINNRFIVFSSLNDMIEYYSNKNKQDK